ESWGGGRYILQREIARGGMGSIWLAFDLMLQRRVVVKRMNLSDQMASGWRGQFEHEAQAVAQLQSPNVVQIFDYGVGTDGAPYIVMELLEGEDLDQRLERQKRLPLAQVVDLVTQAARGPGAAH